MMNKVLKASVSNMIEEKDAILMYTPKYCTDSVVECIMAHIFIYAKQVHNSYMDLKEDKKGKFD